MFQSCAFSVPVTFLGVAPSSPSFLSCSFGMLVGGGAMVLGILLVPGGPTYFDCGRARAICACSRCGWGLFGHFSLDYHFFFLSPSL